MSHMAHLHVKLQLVSFTGVQATVHIAAGSLAAAAAMHMHAVGLPIQLQRLHAVCNVADACVLLRQIRTVQPVSNTWLALVVPIVCLLPMSHMPRLGRLRVYLCIAAKPHVWLLIVCCSCAICSACIS